MGEFINTNEILVVGEDGSLTMKPEIVEKMAEIEEKKKAFDKQFKEYREAIKQAMEENGITKISSDSFTASYIEEGEVIKLNSSKVKKLFPKVYEACTDV